MRLDWKHDCMMLSISKSRKNSYDIAPRCNVYVNPVEPSFFISLNLDLICNKLILSQILYSFTRAKVTLEALVLYSLDSLITTFACFLHGEDFVLIDMKPKWRVLLLIWFLVLFFKLLKKKDACS
jgi:hypothetical protein